ncbi:MAG: phosphoribosyl-ATP diphosphatase [Phycisphaerales bacterium]
MLVPCVDLQGGKAVQLVGGKDRALAFDDVFAWADRLSVFGELAVVDLDAAMGTGDNLPLVRELCARYRCRVGGGVRDESRARELLRAGAQRLMVGTAATPELLGCLPREVWIACLDHTDGVVMDKGWTSDTGERAVDRAKRLADFVGGFLVTNVGVEGRMTGPDATVAAEVRTVTGLPVTAAGGVRSVEDVVDLHRAGLNAQVGMAVYTGALEPADAFLACVDWDKGADGLVPTFVADERGRALMVAWSSPESLRVALTERIGCYQSRSRGEVWRKGATSGHTQRLLRAEVDCDADALRFVVEQTGPACHTGSATCFGERDFDLGALESNLRDRMTGDGYTARLAKDPRTLRRKIVEEAYEVADASQAGERDNLVGEAADVLYHLTTLLLAEGLSLRDVEAALGARRR